MDLSGLLSNNAADQKFMSPLVKTYTKGQSLRLVESSFENIESVTGEKLKGYDIFTNLPFGKMANQHYLTSTVIAKVNDQFDKLLYKVKDYIGEVYIVYPTMPSSKNPHYVSESQFNWQEQLTFENNGFEMGLFRFTKKLKGEVMIVDRSHQKTHAVIKSDLDESFEKINLDSSQPASKKEYQKQESIKQQRRNEYLKELKERWELRKANLEKNKEERRIQKSQKIQDQMEKAGIAQEEVDLLQRKIDKTVKAKVDTKEKLNKPKSIPKW